MRFSLCTRLSPVRIKAQKTSLSMISVEGFAAKHFTAMLLRLTRNPDVFLRRGLVERRAREISEAGLDRESGLLQETSGLRRLKPTKAQPAIGAPHQHVVSIQLIFPRDHFDGPRLLVQK